MKLDKSYKVKVNPEQSREICRLLNENYNEFRGYEYLRIEGGEICSASDYFLNFTVWGDKEITAPELIALLSQDEQQFKAGQIVKCLSCDTGNFTPNKPYVIKDFHGSLGLICDDGDVVWFDNVKNKFVIAEPVLETAIQATNALDDTPMGTRTEFKVGDRVYFPAVNSKVITLPALQDGRFGVVSDYGNEAFIFPNGTYHNGNVAPYIVKATPENWRNLNK